jgi:negative regulator of flagellin synthesis FlgM
MSLNINNLNKSSALNQVQNQAKDVKQNASQAASTAGQATQPKADSLSLTPQAQQLNELQKKANDAPVVDQKKIEKLQKAIASGDYKIDPDKLAASIAKFEFDLV